MRGAPLWAFGVAASLVAHIAVLPLLGLLVKPDSLTPQPSPETQINLKSYRVDQQDAKARPVQGDKAETRDADGPALDASAIELSRLKSQRPASQPANQPKPHTDVLTPQTATGNSLASNTPVLEAVPGQAPRPIRVSAQIVPQAEIASSRPVAPTKAAALIVPANVITSAIAATTAIAASRAPSQTLTPTFAAPAIQSVAMIPQADTVAALAAPATASVTLRPKSGQGAALNPPSNPAIPLPATGASAPPLTLPALATKAALAWEFGDRTVTDAKSLAVIQAFVSPGDLDASGTSAGDVRDGLSDLLGSVDCARLTATYIPETGALELRGHVPDNNMRAPVLAALQDQIGDGITVTDNLLLLPRPQCGALSHIADIGLPQSTEQLTNPLLIGENAQAREFDFSEGQLLTFDLSAPDYDAVIYVDYFDAGGQVIHLAPNDRVPLELHVSKSSFGVGSNSADQPGLHITIGPPYGQEIAVAFASSERLFEELRPLIEPAEPYLAELKAAIARVSAENTGFKGEWVYFFITTSPAIQ